jgi:dATP pyrophosphohydrolase
MTAPKQPVSVLVVIHTPNLDVLLLERAAHPDYWQSVTGSREGDEPLVATAQREVAEETGICVPVADFRDWSLTNTYEIFAEWRHRYAPGVTSNVEHVFSLCLPEPIAVTTSPDEHRSWQWLPCHKAAARCFSWSNRDAILMLPERLQQGT